MTTHDVRAEVWSSHRGAEHGFALLDRTVTSAATHVAASTSTVLVAAGQRVDTQGFVRTHLVEGVVRLVVRPAVGGLVVPFEQPNPTPCCADH